MKRDDDPLVRWLATNKPNTRTEILIDRWLEAAIVTEKAIEIEQEFEAWLTDRSMEVPDLVSCISMYGYARLLIHGWYSIPIDIPVDEVAVWRDADYLPTIEDLQERLAGVAGGFLELAGQAPQLTVDILQGKLASKFTEMEELADLPLDRYTPRRMTADEIEDGDDSYEQSQFDQPFALRQELECFEWALEKLRMYAISERSKEVGLPNADLHHALMKIDLNGLLRRLSAVDPKLRRIWRHLSRHRYFRLNSDIAPEEFWWRHWDAKRR